MFDDIALGYVITFFMLLVYFADRIFIDGVATVGIALVFSGAASWLRAEAASTSHPQETTLDSRWRTAIRWGLPIQITLCFLRFALWLHSYLGDDQAVKDLEVLLYWTIASLQLATTLGLVVRLLEQMKTTTIIAGHRRVYAGTSLVAVGVTGFAFMRLAFPALMDG